MSNTVHDPDDYPWVDCDALRHLPAGCTAVLFGAGQGSVEFIQINRLLPAPFKLLAVADNDSTMWGKRLGDLPIIPPDAISRLHPERVVITTISGKESVTRQLKEMGFSGREDIAAVGKFPSQAASNLQFFLRGNEAFGIAEKGATILHVGPGGFLGLECCLHALDFAPISMDANAFGISYPDVTEDLDKYRRSLQQLLAIAPPDWCKKRIEQRFLALFRESNGRTLVDTRGVPYLFPHRFSAIPLDDSSVDAVISFAVLEHVLQPGAVLREMVRVLKPKGRTFHRVITRDHRSFSKVAGYHPFSYLTHSDAAWEGINKNKFHQNRLLPHEWLSVFQENLSVLHFAPLQPYDLPPEVHTEVTRHRPDLRRDHLEWLNFEIVALKE
jgi:SAM-dependent methyltransferase